MLSRRAVPEIRSATALCALMDTPAPGCDQPWRQAGWIVRGAKRPRFASGSFNLRKLTRDALPEGYAWIAVVEVSATSRQPALAYEFLLSASLPRVSRSQAARTFCVSLEELDALLRARASHLEPVTMSSKPAPVRPASNDDLSPLIDYDVADDVIIEQFGGYDVR